MRKSQLEAALQAAAEMRRVRVSAGRLAVALRAHGSSSGRLKDYEFINAVLRARLADWEVIVKRIEGFSDLHQRAVLLARLRISGERMP